MLKAWKEVDISLTLSLTLIGYEAKGLKEVDKDTTVAHQLFQGQP